MKALTGSSEERAVARMLAAQKAVALNQDDQDALTLYYGARFTNLASDALESAAAYQRGHELAEAQSKPVTPMHLDKAFERSTSASLLFKLFHKREPRAGDVLLYEYSQAFARSEAKEAEEFIAAWGRHIPEPVRPSGNLCGK